MTALTGGLRDSFDRRILDAVHFYTSSKFRVSIILQSGPILLQRNGRLDSNAITHIYPHKYTPGVLVGPYQRTSASDLVSLSIL